MTYEAALQYMLDQMPMYQRVGQIAYKANLNNTLALMEACGHPEQNLVCIHVAGTNGKGSTAHMLASIFQEAGYNTGLYTSPHLIDFRERIKVNGAWIASDFVASFVTKHQPDFERIKPSFFEMTVAMAFQYFKQVKTDIAIIETGLGGRLDSTNVVTPEVSVITNIALDHTHLLGNTLEKIAAEKGGIIKNNVPVVVGDEQIQVQQTLQDIADTCMASFHLVNQQLIPAYASDLTAQYQTKNINTVLNVINVINEQKRFRISPEHIKNGLLQVGKHTGFAGRWQQLQDKPKVIADVGHNHAGWLAILSQLENETYKHLHIVLGTVNDKVLDDVISVLPADATYYACAANMPRALPSSDLHALLVKNNLKCLAYNSVAHAYASALNSCHSGDLILIAGSLFVVGEILAKKM